MDVSSNLAVAGGASDMVQSLALKPETIPVSQTGSNADNPSSRTSRPDLPDTLQSEPAMSILESSGACTG